MVLIMSRFQPIYTEILVVVHGKSEYELATYIRSNLRIKLAIEAENKGKNSIQINSLKNIFGNTVFSSKKNFLQKYTDLNIDSKKRINKLSIYTIMDIDDCTPEEFNNYKNKSMFSSHWLYDYIIPIYNIRNLEDVLEKSGVPFERKNKGNYVNIFPTNRGQADLIQIEDFRDKLKMNSRITNLHLFIDECLDIQKKML